MFRSSGGGDESGANAEETGEATQPGIGGRHTAPAAQLGLLSLSLSMSALDGHALVLASGPAVAN